MSDISFDNIIYRNNRNYTSNGVFISGNSDPMIQSHSYGRNNSSSFKHSFYDVLANYSYFKDNKLVLNHQYVHTQAMNHACWDDIARNVISNMNNYIDENTAIREYLQQVKLNVMAALPASYKSTAYSKLMLPEPEQATESAPAPAPAKRRRVVEYDQPHSSQFLGLTGEDSSDSMVCEIKTVDWLLDTIAHCSDTRHTPSPQQELDQNNNRFYDTIKPFLQPEGSTSTRDPLDLLGQTALLLTPKTASIPNIESSDSAVDAVFNRTSTETSTSTQTSS
ncbi:hypothetical protein GGF39_003790, partial [Coemansia sp. RSA 1721]